MKEKCPPSTRSDIKSGDEITKSVESPIPPSSLEHDYKPQSGLRSQRRPTLNVVGSRQSTKTSMDSMESVFMGKVSDLPPVPTNLVKVYISSTHSGECY